jgi:hypothetical protein
VRLDPTFSPTDTDYVWYCASGTNNLTISLSSSGAITSGGSSGSQISLSVSVVNNQAVIIDAPNGTDYWIRCLPSNFPHLTISGNGSATPGYYVTGSYPNAKLGTGSFPMVVNSFGTPVWYLTGIPGPAQDAELLPGTHTIAWANSPAYRLYSLDTDTVSEIAPPVKPFDGHELFTDLSGNHWMISVPVKKGYNLSSIGFPKVHAIKDCVIQELSPQGKLVWEWTASDHISPDEANKLTGAKVHQGVLAADVYHCNSIDVNPLDSNQILVSMRQSGLYLIDKATGDIIWKLGGTSVPPMGGEPVLTITGDPEDGPIGQHDARFEPNGDVSMFDDHTKTTGAARAIEYVINSTNDTATMSWEYMAPSGANVNAMGSLRRYDGDDTTYDYTGNAYDGPVENVIDWGSGAPLSGFTVTDNTGDVLLNVSLPQGTFSNRATLVPLSALDLAELRDSAGTAFPTGEASPPAPTSATPDTVAQGARYVKVILEGSNFETGDLVTSHVGIKIKATFASTTQLDLRVRVDGTAAVGSYDLSVTNPGGLVGKCEDCLSVTAAS